MRRSPFIEVEEAPMVRKVRTEELAARWQKILEDFAASDCGVIQYCQDRKVSKSSLYKWSERLRMPLKNHSTLAKICQMNNDNDTINSTSQEAPLSFIELKLPPSDVGASFPLKLELLLTQDRKLRMETSSTWDQLVGMIKALVS
jgi:hypothetical protein